MEPLPDSLNASPSLERRIGLRPAVLFNMLEMIGVGPFITLPLVIAAAGLRLSVWAWLLGAAIAVADGLVWAELGAAFPRAGGSYAFLREIYGPQRAGNWLGFLYVWQLSFSAPLSIASGCIGLSSFLAWFWPSLDGAPFAALPALHYANFAAAGACLLVTWMLYRRLSVVTGMAWVLFAGVLVAIAGVIAAGTRFGGFSFQPLGHMAGGMSGLANGTLLATYCYWGYYNITFLGGEVKRPERTIPRAILISVVLVAAMYVAMNGAALNAIAPAAAAGGKADQRLVAEMARSAFGTWAGWTMSALVIWTALSSVFSLLLGYSRVPYAAAKDGNYFRFLAAVHPKHHIPHRSLVALGVVATCFCFLSLSQVITFLVITRILLQFLLQQVGVIMLRVQRPELERPFRMPLYPLPPLLAMAGFVFILVNRQHALGGLVVAVAIGVSGTAIYMVRAKKLGEWPFQRRRS
ncbi:MAG TPA: APC family permease [Terracidiphilus sp.]|jgi:amino acid transporter